MTVESRPGAAEPRAGNPARNAVLAVIALYALVVGGGVVGLWLAPEADSCNTFSDCMRPLTTSALIGMGVGLVLAALVGHFLRMRWWWVPLTAVLLVGAFLVSVALPVLWPASIVLFLAAPALAAVLALPRGADGSSSPSAGRRLVAVVVSLAVIAGGLAVYGSLVGWSSASIQRREVERTGLPVWAPTERSDLEYSVLWAQLADPTAIGYSMLQRGHADVVRVEITAPTSDEPCEANAKCTSPGPGMKVLATDDGNAYGAVRDVPGARIRLTAGSDYSVEQLGELLRDLRQTTPQWIATHADR